MVTEDKSAQTFEEHLVLSLTTTKSAGQEEIISVDFRD